MNDRKGTRRDEASLAPSPALSKDELSKMDAYWRACNYLAAGMIYLRGESAAARAAKSGTHQAAVARSLGLKSRV